jgi:hypothetical protein
MSLEQDEDFSRPFFLLGYVFFLLSVSALQTSRPYIYIYIRSVLPSLLRTQLDACLVNLFAVIFLCII